MMTLRESMMMYAGILGSRRTQTNRLPAHDDIYTLKSFHKGTDTFYVGVTAEYRESLAETTAHRRPAIWIKASVGVAISSAHNKSARKDRLVVINPGAPRT